MGVFIRSDKVLLKGKDPLFSQVRQTFCQCLLSASRAFAAYLLPALPQHCLGGAAAGEGGEAEPQVPSDGEAGTQWEGLLARVRWGRERREMLQRWALRVWESGAL